MTKAKPQHRPTHDWAAPVAKLLSIEPDRDGHTITIERSEECSDAVWQAIVSMPWMRVRRESDAQA